MKDIHIDRVAIWSPKTTDDFAERKSPAGRVYYKNNVAVVSDKPMYRYAKNFTAGKGKSKVKYCLFLMTFSSSKVQIEAFLDEVASAIDAGLAQKAVMTSSTLDFEYLDKYYKGDE